MAYSAPTLTTYARPVQFETPLNGISVVGLSDGRGLILWVNANRVRYAIKSTPADFLADNVVASGDAVTALSGVGDIRAAAVFRVGSAIYFSVHYLNGTSGMNVIYVANSDSSPTSWSVHGTVQSSTIEAGTGYGFSQNAEASGIPYVSGSRWVISSGLWASNFLGEFYRRAGVWDSSDNGVTWTNRISQGYGASGGIYMDQQASQVAKLPNSGQEATTAGSNGGGTTERHMFIGPTWTTNAETYAGLLSPFHGEGDHLFAMASTGKIMRSPSGAVLPMSSWTEVGQYAVGSLSESNTPTMRAVQIGTDWYYTWIDRIAYAAGGAFGPTVGSVGFGAV